MKYNLLWVISISCFIAHETYATPPCTSNPCNNGGTCYTGLDSYICVCPTKYSGQNCDLFQDADYSINPCTASTCSNGGTCFTGPNGSYFCACASGFNGTQCERQANSTTSAPNVAPCNSTTCSNGGTCYTGSLGSFYCVCPSEYTGRHCESMVAVVPPFAVNYCSPNPCNNNGTCYTGRTEFICLCPNGFAGRLCDTQLYCSSNPCLNQGVCFTGPSSYTCVCRGGHTGAHCETVSCIDSPCLNDGTCIPAGVDVDDTMCVCRENYYGDRCEHQTNICSANEPCLNGGTCYTSSENHAEFVCNCQHGFEGSLCERSNPCADNPCLNGGVCSHPLDPTNDMILCQCTNGFVGLRCEIVDTGVGACVTGVCMNGGTCVPSPFAPGGLTCTCPVSHTGSHCEQQIPLACESNPCLYGASCSDVGDGNYQCICLEGYAGRRCEVIGPCVSSPCMNGGICVEDVYYPGNFLCQCQNQYTGTTCTIPPQEDPCNSSPCQNNGVCILTSEGVGYRCNCTKDFVGQKCDIPDPCSPSPCLNSGACNAIPVSGGNWGFYCVCTDLFLGLTCGVQRACVSSPCLHGGVCTDVPATASQPIYGTELTSEMLHYNCNCLDGWTGQNCEMEINDPCTSSPCQNNGTCFRSHSAERFFCSCLDDFYGPFCEADPCAAKPCKNNATCQSAGRQHLCICSTGYSGINCNVEDACRTNPCDNGGTCHVTDTGFECMCTAGYTGADCSQQDPCFPKPCLNGGICLNVRRGAGDTMEYQCLCQLGFGGLTCGVYFGDVNKCLLNVCENGGSCYQGAAPSSGRYVCVCTGGYDGDHCEHQIERPLGSSDSPTEQPCSPDPCLNGGMCYQGFSESTYRCTCPATFTGTNCENLVRATTTAPSGRLGATQSPSGQNCSPDPCLNGGTCSQDGDGSYTCMCPDDFTGTNCQDDVLVSTTRASGCVYGDHTYADGETWQDGCRDCVCNGSEWSCTNERCKCIWNGQIYNNGRSWEVGCELCTCVSGVASCSAMKCQDRCFHESMIYESGTNRTDKCNTCVCLETVWTCTSNACGQTCTYKDVVYLANEERLDVDNCNTCSCSEGQWTCTNRECSDDPIIIKVEFAFSNDFSLVVSKQEAFKMALKGNLLSLLGVGDKYIQNLTISEGSIKVNLNLVDDRKANINIENVLIVLENAVSRNGYSFTFDSVVYKADPNSFKTERVDTTPDPPNTLIIIIAVSVCGGLGVLIVIGSVCWLVKRHRTTRGITKYDGDRLPRRSDKPSWDGIENAPFGTDRSTSNM